MFGIKVNGEYLDLFPNNTITLQVINDHFSDDVIRASGSLPFELPRSPRNLRLLKYPTEYNNIIDFKTFEIPCQLIFGGLPYMISSRIKLITIKKTIKIYVRLADNSLFVAKDRTIPSYFETLFDAPPGNIIDYMFDSIFNVSGDYNLVFAPLRNTGLQQNNITGVINAFDPAVGQFLGSSGDNDYTICPYYYLHYVIDFVFNSLGIRYKSNFFSSEDFRKLVLYNAATKIPLDGSVGFYAQFFIDRHVPNVTTGNFFNAWKQLFGLGYDFMSEDGLLQITTFNEYLESDEYVDITDKLERYTEIQFDKGFRDGFVFKYTYDNNDDYDPLRQENELLLKTGNGANEIQFDLDYPFAEDKADTSISLDSWIIPEVVQDDGEIQLFSNPPFVNEVWYKIAPYAKRLLFYHGWQPNSNGDNYPMLSPYSKDINNVTLTDFSLNLNHVDGVYEKFLKRKYNILERGKQPRGTIYLKQYDLYRLSRCKKAKYKGRKFLLDNMDAKIRPNSEIVEVEAEFYLEI